MFNIHRSLILRFVINIAIALTLSHAAFAQKDTTKLTFRDQFMPTGVRVGTDALSIARNFYDDSFKGWEVNADVDFNRYFLAIEYGKWSRNYLNDSTGYSSDYSNEGRYWRAGVDVNFLLKDPERNMFFLGLRYGRSVFSETYAITDVDGRWGSLAETYYNNDVAARWFELTTGLKVRMFSWFWMGYTARFKFGLKTGETPTMLPHDVPGYGRTDKESYWGFNYQLMFRIPIREHPPLSFKKKK